MSANRRSAFTLIEILIVVVIMAVLAATIVPQFTDSTEDAKTSTTVLNLNTLRHQIALYKVQHGGGLPSGTLEELIKKTDADGTVNASGKFGVYLNQIPENSVTGDSTIKVITADNMVVGDLTSGGGGWVYSTASGKIWVDHADHWSK